MTVSSPKNDKDQVTDDTHDMFQNLQLIVEMLLGTRVYHKLSTIQECQYCQLHFSCAISNELKTYEVYNLEI